MLVLFWEGQAGAAKDDVRATSLTWPPDQVVYQLQFLVQEIPFPNKWATTALCQL